MLDHKKRAASILVSNTKYETQFGIFTSLTQATYLDSFQFAEVPGDTEVELRSGILPGSLVRRGVFEVESQFPP